MMIKNHHSSISIPYKNIDRETLRKLMKEFKINSIPFRTNTANGRVYFNKLFQEEDKMMAKAIIQCVIYKNSTLDYWWR